jgi:hypothetical protein
MGTWPEIHAVFVEQDISRENQWLRDSVAH